MVVDETEEQRQDREYDGLPAGHCRAHAAYRCGACEAAERRWRRHIWHVRQKHRRADDETR